MTVVFATAILAGPVLAFKPGPATGDVDPFNPTDATPSCVPGTLVINDPTAGSASVAYTCTETGGYKPVTVTWISDTLSGSATDNAWGQGDKSDCYLAKTGGVSGACVTQVYGIGASKTDLQYHGIGLAKGSDGHDYLYSGIKRLQAGGVTSSNANYNVEINQLLDAYKPADPICDGTNTGGCNIWRSPGDLTFMTDWGGNQSSCNTATPAICAYVWIDFSGPTPSEAGSTCFNAKSAPCWGLPPNGSAALSENPNKAAGSINETAAVQPYTFSEIGVDLTASGLVQEGACKTFKEVWAHSRSSSSFTAELKDFIFGDVTIDTCTSTSTTLHERATSTGGTDVDPANNGKTITVNTGAWVNDVATVTGNNPTGTVSFRYYSTSTACTADTTGTGGTDAGSGKTVTSGSATSDTKQFNTSGTYYWRAFFDGTGGTSDSTSACDEILTVRQNTSVGTELHERTTSTGDIDVLGPNNGLAITVNVGAWVNDVATVSPSSATGTVSFRYYSTSTACTADTTGTGGTDAGSGKTVTSGSATSDTKQFNTPGTYYWRAFFDGSGLNNDSISPCNEILTVNAVNTAISTSPFYYPNDSATVTAPNGGGDPTGSVKFRLYDTAANCTAVTPSDTVGQGGLLYKQAPQDLPAAAPFTVSTSNTTVKVSTSTSVWWLVEFTSTNPAQIGRNSVCVENINATLTGDSLGTAGNTP
jgi:hypothetical protein